MATSRLSSSLRAVATSSSASSRLFSTTRPARVVKELSSASSFDSMLSAQSSSSRPAIIDFTATWCPPCKVIGPVFSKLSDDAKLGGAVDFYKVDVDEVPEVAQRCNVRAMPTFVVFEGGEKKGEMVGADPNGLKVSKQRSERQLQSCSQPLPTATTPSQSLIEKLASKQ